MRPRLFKTGRVSVVSVIIEIRETCHFYSPLMSTHKETCAWHVEIGVPLHSNKIHLQLKSGSHSSSSNSPETLTEFPFPLQHLHSDVNSLKGVN